MSPVLAPAESGQHQQNPISTSISPVLAPESSEFDLLAEKGILVDKTQAIVDFLGGYAKPVHLLLRPRRAGKTTLLRTFQAFFEHGRSPADVRRVRDLFANNQLEVTRNPCFDNEFGRYPVLYIDFSSSRHATYAELVEDFKFLLADIAKDLQIAGHLRSSSTLAPHERQYIEDLRNCKLSEPNCLKALQRLCKFTFELTGRKVVILVDEYDTPMSEALEHGYLEQANTFFKNVFSPLLKNNPFLRGALLVGILPLAKASWLSGVNNLDVFCLGESEYYSTSCMFTEEETRSLFNKQNEALGPDRSLPFTFENLRAWYNGYATHDGTKLYNPWVIGLALSKKKLGPYWVQSGYDKIIGKRIRHMLRHEPKFRENVAALLEGRHITVHIVDNMLYQAVSDMSMSELWTLMYYAGYTTRAEGSSSQRSSNNHSPDGDVANGSNGDAESETGGDRNSHADGEDNTTADGEGDTDSSDDTSSEEGHFMRVRIPNHEIRSVFRGWVQMQLSKSIEKAGLTSSNVKLFDAMIRGSLSKFSRKLRHLVLESMPRQLLGNKEVAYHAYLCALITEASQNHPDTIWVVDPERHGGIGRLDLLVYGPGDCRAAIQEFKSIRLLKRDKEEGYGEHQSRRLTDKAKSALEQIKVKHYRNTVPEYVTVLHEYGIAFLGVFCAIEGRSLSREKAGRPWKVTEVYSSNKDEVHRMQMYPPLSTS